MRHVPRQQERLYLRIDFERLRPIRPVQEVRIVTNTPVGVLRAIVILPSRLRVAVVHRLLHQTSTRTGSQTQAIERALSPAEIFKGGPGPSSNCYDRGRPNNKEEKKPNAVLLI